MMNEIIAYLESIDPILAALYAPYLLGELPRLVLHWCFSLKK